MEIDQPVTDYSQKRGRGRVSYKETDSEEENETIKPQSSGKRRRLVRRIEDDSDEEFTPSAKDKEKVDEDDAVFDDISDTELMEIERDYTATKNKTAMTPIAERFERVSVSSPSRPTTSSLFSSGGHKPPVTMQSKQQVRNMNQRRVNDNDLKKY
ncbi:hypothetical protein G6F35_014278 [Rhizopus arrhizus]|nr:hypothetical protein G6F35_014278 [Rhizopus arrhizus]